MRYILTGVETNNKGAELMMYGILQQIEKNDTDATVYPRMFAIRQGLDYIHTSVKLKNKPYKSFVDIANKLKIPNILGRLGVSTLMFSDAVPVKNIDVLFDASGFWFTDQWNLVDFERDMWMYMLKKYHEQGTKIVFLPQAFGPIEKKNTKEIIDTIGKYADIIMPRESVSLDYMKKASIDSNKLFQYPDFTNIVKGVFPKLHQHLKNGICIIPNIRMIDKGTISKQEYIEIIKTIIYQAQKCGKQVYLLNHEGASDAKLCKDIAQELGESIDVADGLNALEVKGLIASSYLCVSSRFHGVASALNSNVPCLATSWSHKYSLLFDEYNQQDCILDLKDKSSIESKIELFLSVEHNTGIREQLKKKNPSLQSKTEEMWKQVWSFVK